MMPRPQPRTSQELHDLIVQRIVLQQPDLNDIDISLVTDMSNMFRRLNFQGDISRWDVSHVTSMAGMFDQSTFNGDISQWNVGLVTNMDSMFLKSAFRGDLSQWNVGNVTNMRCMFMHSMFNGNLSKWDVARVEDFYNMFFESHYGQDLNGWTPTNAKIMVGMLWNEHAHDIYAWRVPSDCSIDYLMRPTTMVSFDKPSFYHFFLLYTQQLDFVAPDRKAFVEHHRPILQGMGMSPTQAAVWLHAAWYEGISNTLPAIQLPCDLLP